MNELLKLDRWRWTAIALAGLAAALLFWPTPNRAAPVLTVPAPRPVLLQPMTEESAIALFDLSTLPPIKAPPPPPVAQPVIDPAAAIKRYTLLGVTVNELGAIALLGGNGQQQSLKQGDMLDGFAVVQILPRQIDFQKNDIAVSLVLPASEQQTPN